MAAPPSPLPEHLLTDNGELRDDKVRAVLRPSTRVDAIAQDEDAKYTRDLTIEHEPSTRGFWGLLQTATNPFCSFHVPSQHETMKWIAFELYFVPLVDTVILKNLSKFHVAVSGRDTSSAFDIAPAAFHLLSTGAWSLRADDKAVAELHTLPNPYSMSARMTESVPKTRKRARDDEDGLCSELVVSTQDEPITALELGRLPVGHTVSIGVHSVKSYTICKSRQIASTALSDVFSATHSKLGLIVVKYVKPGRPGYKGHSADLVMRAAHNWVHETRVQEQLDHEAIVRIRGADAGLLYIYQELVEGHDLGSTYWKDLNSYMFIGTEAQADLIVKGTISALAYLHDLGIVHGDIKPRNLLYPPLKICDFGLAHKHGAWRGGSPHYIGPELLVSFDKLGKHTDIFALGVTALFLHKQCTLPESRKDWQIADVHTRKSSDKRQEARNAMGAWLDEVAEYRSKLNDETDPCGLLRDMTNPESSQRTSARELERRCRPSSSPGGDRHGDAEEQEADAHAASPYGGSTTQEDSQDLYELYLKKQRLLD